ncbi:energy transducer TonB [Hymenobacter sp. 5414T-23]|nr:energy transducer TonB [Hymenobacter sp. 5414T-23]UOQ81063.1 energy transducer TonB [Hymenobacter sp. 5414T-23]
MPDFVGGQAALAKYLQRHLRYPASALRSSISGRVFVAFTVNSDGTIKDVEILKGLGYGTDEEATRVISAMPAWKPGRQNNRAVPVRYTLPITFRYE